MTKVKKTRFNQEDGLCNMLIFGQNPEVYKQKAEKETHDTSVRLSDLAVPGSDIDEQEYITFEGNQVKKIDTDVYVKKITRMKPTPAFDALSLESPENEELFAWIDKLAQ